MRGLLDLFKKPREIVVVSGLPRSGTSMMMKMLTAGGMTPLIDNIRTADEDNPRGYYEHERVKKLDKGDSAWLGEAGGKAVKIISALLLHLPDSYRYRVVFMQRAIPEVLASQQRMIIRRGEDPHRVSDEELTRLYAKHLAHVESWIDRHENVSALYVSYNRMLREPAPYVHRTNAFLGGELDESRMAQVVDPSLYRQRITSDRSRAGDEKKDRLSESAFGDLAGVRCCSPLGGGTSTA